MDLPKNSQHTFICGKTGSGKTNFAGWVWSQCDFTNPWIILDHKRDPDLWSKIGRLDRVKTQRIPPFTRPRKGIAIIRPSVGVHDQDIEKLLWDIHKKGNTGIFVDEAYLLPRNSVAMQNILATGRSKKIQVIACAQRPTNIPLLYLSESSFLGIFRMDFKGDRDRVGDYTPLQRQYMNPPLRHCYWVEPDDQTPNEVSRLLPCPGPSDIVATVADRLPMPLW